MPRLPVLKPREVIARLERLGFVAVRQRGSHKLEPTRIIAPSGRPGAQGIDSAIRAANGELLARAANER